MWKVLWDKELRAQSLSATWNARWKPPSWTQAFDVKSPRTWLLPCPVAACNSSEVMKTNFSYITSLSYAEIKTVSPGGVPSPQAQRGQLLSYLVRHWGWSTYTPSWYLSCTVSRSRLARVLAACEASTMLWDFSASASKETQPGEENIPPKSPASISGGTEVSDGKWC